MSLKPLTPPLRFSTAAFASADQLSNDVADTSDPRLHPHHRESVYRGAYPKARNLYFLSRLHLRTVLSLTPRPLDNDTALLAWASSDQRSHCSATSSEEGSNPPIQLLHVRCEKPKDESGGLTREGAARALSILLDRRNHPIYVHCLDGVEVTSTLVACMRKVQAWSTPAILAELGRALRDSNSSEWTQVPSHLSSFLNKFGQPDGIRLPPRNHLPSWLWPAPNPLSILANPYAWAGSSSLVNGSALNASAPIASSIPDASMSRSPSTLPDSHLTNGITHHPRRDGQLPILHPTLKLHFEFDPDLPSKPSPILASTTSSAATASSTSQRPMTPSRPGHLQAHSRSSSYTSVASLRTPPHSRPASRAGRPSNPGTAHPLAARSASQAADGEKARTPSNSSLLGAYLAGSSAGAVPSIAAFLEDQVSGADNPSFASSSSKPIGNESPTRRPRSNLSIDPSSGSRSPLNLQPASTSPTKNIGTVASVPAELDDLDEVSTPRARPTTSPFNIGIAGTIFHHDDDIPDTEGEASAGANGLIGPSGRIVVPLEKRRRRPLLLEDDEGGEEGEQTPTKANALARTSQISIAAKHAATDEEPRDIVGQTSEDPSRSEHRLHDKINRHRQDEANKNQVGVSRASEDPDNQFNPDTGADTHEEAIGEEQDEVGQEEVEEEEEEGDDEDGEEDEEEEELSEEEEEEDDEDEDDLALQALDLEGY